MKNLIMTILLLSSTAIWAGDSLFEEEEYKENITPAEEAAAKSYIHRGRQNSASIDMCVKNPKKYKDICGNKTSGFKKGTMQTVESFLPAVTAAYNVMFGASLTTIGQKSGLNQMNEFETSVKDKDGATLSTYGDITRHTTTSWEKNGRTVKHKYTDKAGKELDNYETSGFDTKLDPFTQTKGKPQKDYCAYIAAVGDLAQTTYQQLQNSKTKSNVRQTKDASKQAAYFSALAKTHDNLAKSSKIQMGVWGSTAGCYVAVLASTNIIGTNWKFITKLAATTTITAFYTLKTKAHKERASILRSMANKMPGAGNCNPYTDTMCFCDEPTSFSSDPENYTKYCVPERLAGNGPANKVNVCIGANKRVDPECKCKKTNTCIDKILKMGAIDLGIPANIMKDPMSGLNPVAKGYDTGNLDAVTGRNLFKARAALKKYQPGSALGNLTDEQRELASNLTKFNIPKAAAASIAKNSKGSNVTPPALLSGLSGSTSAESMIGQGKDKPSFKPKSTSFKKGGTIATKRKRSRRSKRRRHTKKVKGGIEFSDFAEKAERQAEILPRSGASIFDSISRRYKVKTWKEIDFKKVVE